MNRKRKAIIAANEISELKTYSLGGYPQKVLIDGRKRTNPIVIFLHGGPGSPIPFNVGCRGLFPEITDQVTMVYWDQLGCGINNHVIDETFTIDSFVNMTIDLIKHIRNDFPDNKINIFGVSWGSILAAKVARAIPELIHKIVVYGQVLKQIPFNNDVFETLEKSKIPIKYKEKLSHMKQSSSHNMNDIKTIVKWINKYTEGYQSKEGGKASLGPIIRGMISSPDYTLKDFKAVVINAYRKNETLLKELTTIDLSEILKEIELPYFIIQGSTDIVTSTKMISEYLETVQNENLHFQLVTPSGHMPNAISMDVIINTGFGFLKEEGLCKDTTV